MFGIEISKANNINISSRIKSGAFYFQVNIISLLKCYYIIIFNVVFNNIVTLGLVYKNYILY